MRTFDLPETYDIIFIPFNSIHHLYNNQDFFNTLLSVKKHLKKDGYFIFDCFNPNIHYIVQAEQQELVVGQYTTQYGREVVVKQTLTVYGKTNYEVSLSFTAHDAPRDPHAWDDALDEITRTYLVVEQRPENEKEMPNLALGGGIAREWHTNIQHQLLGEETYVTSPYFLIRQDDLSELYTIIPVTWENDSTTYVYGTFTTQLQLKEKNKITLPRSTGYKYKDLEYLIPRQFHYPQVPKETLRSPIVPYYNPYYNPY